MVFLAVFTMLFSMEVNRPPQLVADIPDRNTTAGGKLE
jgi:hypothetical protein